MKLTAAEIGEKVAIGQEAVESLSLRTGVSEEQDEQIVCTLAAVMHFADASGWDTSKLVSLAQDRFELDRDGEFR